MNIPEWQQRTKLLLGDEKLNNLAKSHVFIAGLGGVGGFVAEFLCRAGIGHFTLADHDTVHAGNRNRQIIAMKSTENKPKIDLIASRLSDINPHVKLQLVHEYLDEQNISTHLEGDFGYVVDSIDTLTPKLALIKATLAKNIPLVSSMGSGGKTDPSKVEVADISKSYNCRLAYYLRKHLHRAGIFEGFKVVFSPEAVPRSALYLSREEVHKRSVVGTISYMPPLFACHIASVVIADLGIGRSFDRLQ